MSDIVIHKIKLQLVSPTKYNWKEIASEIIQGCNTPYMKAKAIYMWLCNNISYDTTFCVNNSDDAITRRKGTCQAYCELFYRLGRAVGLDVRIISGKTKNVYSKIDSGFHGWIAIGKLDSANEKIFFPEYIIYDKGKNVNDVFTSTQGLNIDNSILIDPTWGAGFCENGRFVKRPANTIWFDVNPYWMIFTHYPDNPKDQLLGSDAISFDVFKNLRHLTSQWEDYGFNSYMTFKFFTKSNSFPQVYLGFESYIEFEDIPVTPVLDKNVAYTFCLIKKKDCKLALINNDVFYTEQDGNLWKSDGTKTFITISNLNVGKLNISIQNPNDSKTYCTVLQYSIKSNVGNHETKVQKLYPKNQGKMVNDTYSESKKIDTHGSYGALNFDKRWIAKKKHILERDHYKCRFCGSSNELTVHHTQYHITPDGKRFLPWEYDDCFLITVCKSCYTKKMSKTKTPTKIATITKRLFE